MKNTKRAVSLLLVFLLAIGMTFSTGCTKKSGPAGTLAVTIGDKKIYLNEIMYYIYAVEASGAQYDQAYQQRYGSSYWDMEYSKGVTMREQSKKYVMDTAIMYEILYDKSVAAGNSLTKEEKAANQTKTDNLFKNITDEQLKITGFDEEVVLKILEKLSIGAKYYTSLVDGFAIDDKAITDTIKYNDFRQYNTEYLYIATSTIDKANKAVALPAKDKKVALESITAALEKVKSGEEFAAITTADTTIKASSVNFVYGDTKAEVAYEDAAKVLDNGKYTTEIVETNLGYYIIKMVDNKATESYDNAVASAIAVEEEKAFNAEYEIIKKDFTTIINNKIWDPIVMGETTLVTPKTK